MFSRHIGLSVQVICCVICYVLLSFSFFPVKQEQIISMLSVWRYGECENVFFCKIIWPRTVPNGMIGKRGEPNTQTQKTWLTSDNKVNNQKQTWLMALIDKDSGAWECLFQQDDLIEGHLKSGWYKKSWRQQTYKDTDLTNTMMETMRRNKPCQSH